MEEPHVLYRRSITDSGKETDKRKSNHRSKVKNSPSVKDALKEETKHKIKGNASPRSPMTLRKKLSIALGAGRFSNLSNVKTEKGDNSCYSPHSDSGHKKEFGVSCGRNVTNAMKGNDMRKSNVWIKHDMKRKMVGNASPRSPMILRKKPSIAMSPSRLRNSSNVKREKGYSQPMKDSFTFERRIPEIAEGNDMRKSNVWIKHDMKRKMVVNASPRSPMILRKMPSIAMSPSRFRNSSNMKREKGYSQPMEDSVSFERRIPEIAEGNDMRKSNVWIKHDMKRKMVVNASPRSPMILRKKPSIAMSPSRFRNSLNMKREKGYSQPTEDSVSFERRIPEIAEEKDMKKSIHQSHVTKSPSTKDVCVKDKMKLQTEGNASPRSSMILRKMRSITVATRFRNLCIQRKENVYDSCRGNFPSVCSSPHGDLGMNYTGKSMCLRCSKLTRKGNDSHRRFCSCSTKVVDELAASFEDSEGHMMKTSCCSETRQSDGSYDLCVECNQPGSLVYCGGKDCRRGYHTSCSAPTLNNIQPGAWLCFFCLQKKMKFGAYSISHGIESILDSTDEIEEERHYYVKFKSLAPIHNCWISRSQLLIKDHVRLAKFDKKWRRGQGSKQGAECHDLSYKTSNLLL